MNCVKTMSIQKYKFSLGIEFNQLTLNVLINIQFLKEADDFIFF